jgi:hypothetical protein
MMATSKAKNITFAKLSTLPPPPARTRRTRGRESVKEHVQGPSLSLEFVVLEAKQRGVETANGGSSQKVDLGEKDLISSVYNSRKTASFLKSLHIPVLPPKIPPTWTPRQ